MTAATDTASGVRMPLNRDRVLEAAVALADDAGMGAVTMRRLGQSLGVEAMSLYNHVANKDDLMDGMLERVMREVADGNSDTAPPRSPDDWKRAIRERIMGARTVMLRHPWAPGVFETRTEMLPSVLAYHDELLGIMRAGGFSWDLAHHAMHALGSRALGFTQELFVPADDADPSPLRIEHLMTTFPNIGGMLAEISHDPDEDSLGWCDDQTEFVFGLDLLLDGLDGMRDEIPRSPATPPGGPR